jgi:two-component system, cell cycle response regulator
MQQPIKVLVADDDPVACKILEAKLRERGYDPIIARDGHDAWQLLQGQDAPRIAILDWMMPGLSGPDICRRLRAETAARYTYVLLATARTAQRDLIIGFEAGADDYITKPVGFAELEARLRTGVRVIELEQRLLDAQAELEIRASRDALTGAWNRRAITEMLDNELSRSRRQGAQLSISLVDIDHFKQINDRFGHAGGDAVLREVVTRLSGTLRPYDMVGRYGGEEFLVIKPNCDAEQARRVAERLRHELCSRQLHVSATTLAVSASFGVAAAPLRVPCTSDELISAADASLYEAKRAGRNRVHVSAGPARSQTEPA